VIILDNSERPEYAAAGAILGDGWREAAYAGPIAYSSALVTTTVWQRTG
jgi:hypothetical protein